MHLQCDLDKKSLTLTFFTSLFLTLIIPVISPAWRLTFFAPCLIVCIYQNSLAATLSLAIACGVIIDLFTSHSNLGIHATAYSAAILLIYSRKKHVFADSITTLPLMTFLFSSLATLGLAVVLHLLDLKDLFSWKWAGTDLIIYPFIDAFYAFTVFILPALLFGKRIPRGSDYFQTMKK